MKKFLKVFGFIAIALLVMFIPTVAVFAQDSTAVDPASGAVGDLFTFLIGFVPAKVQPTVFTIVTGLFLLEQILAATNKIKANSTFQLIAGWIGLLYKLLKGKQQG